MLTQSIGQRTQPLPSLYVFGITLLVVVWSCLNLVNHNVIPVSYWLLFSSYFTCFVLFPLECTRSQLRASFSLRRSRLETRAKIFYRRHAYAISLSRSKAKYCWTKYMAGTFSHYVPLSYGPIVTRRAFDHLLRLRTFSSLLNQSSLALRAGHVYIVPVSSSLSGTFDNSNFVGSPQTTIDVAASVNAAVLGTPYAGEIFREAVKHSLVVNTALTDRQRKIVEREANMPLVFKNIVPVASDHAVVSACREVTRQVYETCFKINRTKLPTLAVGSTSSEYTKYTANNYVDYYFHGVEAKDSDRTVRWFLNDFIDNISKKCGHGSKHTQRNNSEANRIRYDSFKQMLADYKELKKIPDRFKLAPTPGYSQLLFEDSFYNFAPEDYKEIFKITGANWGFGYGLLPMDLLFPDMPQNNIYRLTREGAKIHLNFSYANGYCHDERTWATLLRSPVMRFSDFALVTEIVSYVGAMATFKIMKVVESGETISRTIALPENKQYVRVLDMMSSTDSSGKLVRKSYMSVFASEYFEALNYCLSIDPKSLTLHNTMTFVRRRAGGVSLISKELLAPWHLKSRDFFSFSLTVYLMAKMVVSKTEKVDALNSGLQEVKNLGSVLAGLVKTPVKTLLVYVRENALQDSLVIFPNTSLKQREQIVITNPSAISYELKLDESFEEKFFACPICGKLDANMGQQVVKCEHKNHSVTVSMSDADLKNMEAKLADDDNDAPGLAAVKKRAKIAMPKAAFEHTARFHYILGGPGCGKSKIIRDLATQFDLIYAPFTKLMPDYKNIINELGEKVDLNFATVHRGLESRGVSTIFIDEFTSLPMEYIKMVIAVNKAEDIFIVGDTNQSRVQTNEGTYIGDVIDIDSLPRHTLLRNFRNPQDAVALLNRNFGYEMEAMSEVKKSIYVLGPDEEAPEELRDKPFHKFTFCYASLARHSLTADDTVRKYQGSTVDYAELYVDADSSPDTSGKNLSAVALSRHRQALLVRHDGSARALAWLRENNLHGDIPTECDVHHEKEDATKPLSFGEKEAERFVETKFVRTGPKPEPPQRELRKPFFTRDRFFFLDSCASVYYQIFSSGRFWSYVAIYIVMSKLVEYFDDHQFASDLLSLVFLVCRSLMLKVAYTTVASMGPNADLHVLFHHLLYSRIFFGNTKLLHFYTSFLPAMFSGGSLSSYLVIPYFGAKVKFIARLFSLEETTHTNRLLIMVVSVFVLFPFVFLAGNDHFCDFLSRPYAVFLILVARYKNLRLSTTYPFYSYDAVFTSYVDSYEYFISAVNQGFSGGSEYVEYMTGYLPTLPVIARLYNPAPEVLPKDPKEQAPKDSHLMAKELMPAVASEELIDYHNNVGSAQIPDDYYTGVISEDFLNPLTVKHKPANTLTTFFQILPGTGNVFNGKSLPQLLQVMGSRYFNRKPRALRSFDRNAEMVAEDVVNQFFLRCMNEVTITEEDIAIVSGEFAESARVKKYENMFRGFDNFDAHTIRFHLKDIFKPKIASIADPTKAGQGISAWSKDAQVMFGIGARLANYLMCKCTKPNVIYDNRMSSEDMKERVTALMTSVPKTAKNGITDFTMFDSQQDRFTQHMEKHFMRKLGFSEEFVEHYYSFRTNYKIIGGPVAGNSRYEKTSGEPMTLLMNTIISGCLSDYFLLGDGDFMLAMKGDDGFKRQCNMKIDEHRYNMITQYTCLRMKVDISDEAEFCGYVITDNLFVDSIPRKLHKLLSHHFRSYDHFCLYQQSLRDFVGKFENHMFFGENLVANVALYEKQGATYDEMLAMYNCIKSFSHINEDQFYESVCRVSYDSIYKTAEGPLIQYFDRLNGKVWREREGNSHTARFI